MKKKFVIARIHRNGYFEYINDNLDTRDTVNHLNLAAKFDSKEQAEIILSVCGEKRNLFSVMPISEKMH